MDERDVYKAKEAVDSALRRVPLLVPVIIGILIVILLFFRPFVQIGAGERGVVLNFGAVQETVLDEGLHFRVPIMQTIVPVDVKVQKSESEAAAASSDLQDVSSKVALNYHIIPEKANVVYQTIGLAFKERIIDPAVQEVVKAVTAKYTAEELITKRPAVSAAMNTGSVNALAKHGIEKVRRSAKDSYFRI